MPVLSTAVTAMIKICMKLCAKIFISIILSRYIVIMSGLNMSSKKADHMFSLHLLMEWLCGLAGTSEYQGEICNIVRVIVAGNFVNKFILSYHL